MTDPNGELCGPLYAKLCRIAKLLDHWIELRATAEVFGKGQAMRRELAFLVVRSDPAKDTTSGAGINSPIYPHGGVERAAGVLLQRLGWVRDNVPD
jgi:hypothetical protein